MCDCGEQHNEANRPVVLTPLVLQQYDPTRTLTLRDRFAREMRVRFNKLASDVVKSVGVNDAFGLRVNAPAQTNQFAFPTNAGKVDAFMKYLRELEQEYILSSGRTGTQIITIPGRTGAINPAWTDVYIASAYQRGIRRGRQELAKIGAIPDPDEFEMTGDPVSFAFNQPFHADRAGLLYTRVYSDLVGITTAMDHQISRVLSQGLMEGKGPRELARQLNSIITGSGGTLDVIDTLGRFIPARRRAETLARTEVIRAHHLATIQEYRNAGIEGVEVQAEFTTAGDDRVCQECADLNGQIFTLDEIEFVIPVHPNCRCIALPVLDMNDSNQGATQ